MADPQVFAAHDTPAGFAAGARSPRDARSGFAHPGLVVNARFLGRPVTGVERVAEELCRALIELAEDRGANLPQPLMSAIMPRTPVHRGMDGIAMRPRIFARSSVGAIGTALAPAPGGPAAQPLQYRAAAGAQAGRNHP